MIATTLGRILRYRWDGSQNLDYCLDLSRVPFCIDQQVSKGKIFSYKALNNIIIKLLKCVFLLSAIPIVEKNIYVIDIEYSPLVGGFAIVLNDGRAAFLTASSLRFDPNVSYLFFFI